MDKRNSCLWLGARAMRCVECKGCCDESVQSVLNATFDKQKWDSMGTANNMTELKICLSESIGHWVALPCVVRKPMVADCFQTPLARNQILKWEFLT